MSETSSSEAKSRPSEFYIDQKYDRCIDYSLRRVVYGSLAGGLVAAIVFRSTPARAATLAFGAGFGAGSAWNDCQKEFKEASPKP